MPVNHCARQAYVLGLTGSIGMGKTEAAKTFAAEGADIFDADLEVHRLYAPGGAAVSKISALFPDVCTCAGGIDRQKLSLALAGSADKLKVLEAIVHPLLIAALEQFLEHAHAVQNLERGPARHVAVLNIPLLFEAGLDRYCDGVAVVSAPADIQRTRVMMRPGMTAQKFAQLLARQIPDDEKRRRADFLIDSGGSLDCSRQQVIRLIRQLRETY